MMKRKEITKLYKSIKDDYSYNSDVMCQDSPRVMAAKKAVEGLGVVDRTIIILYAETQSLRKVGELLGVSHQTIKNEIKRIRQKVCSQML